MRTVPVTSGNRDRFQSYCEQYGKDHDDSFIPDAGRVPDASYPACLLMEGDAVEGAACLVRTPPFVADRKGRFLIFHTVSSHRAGYAALLEGIRPHFQGLDRVYLFVPEAHTDVRKVWQGLGFNIERYSYLLSCRSAAMKPPQLSPDFQFRPVLLGDEASMTAAVDLDNLNFDGQPGHVEYSVEKLAEDLAGEDMIEGGLMLLYHRDRPVATVWVSRDDEPGASFISMLTVHPEYRGRGLGRAMLRQAVAFSHARGLETGYLSVSAENEAAVRLYLSEGFTKEKVLVCYQMFV